jgi:(R,R)-butanediol dehydrogenase/meso-butanediol dehydrogenase/diacetyl reductase
MIATDKIPIIPGHEFSGKVVELGEGVSNLSIGDRVAGIGSRYCGECYYCKRFLCNVCSNPGFTGLTADGCMAEYLATPAYSLYKLPDSVSDDSGALVEPLAVAFHAIHQGKVGLGDKVAIVGDGTIGLCTLIAVKATGVSSAYVIAKHKGRGEQALAMGATGVIYLSEGDTVQRIKNLTGGLGVDVSFECVGQPDTPQLAMDLTRNGGTTVITGVFEKPGLIDFFSIMFNQKTIVGSPIYVDEAETVIALLSDKRIEPGNLITSMVPLEDAVEMGFEKLIDDKEDNIKILLQIP